MISIASEFFTGDYVRRHAIISWNDTTDGESRFALAGSVRRRYNVPLGDIQRRAEMCARRPFFPASAGARSFEKVVDAIPQFVNRRY